MTLELENQFQRRSNSEKKCWRW